MLVKYGAEYTGSVNSYGNDYLPVVNSANLKMVGMAYKSSLENKIAEEVLKIMP